MALTDPFTHKIQNVQRFAAILRVLARHGFSDIAQRVGIERLIEGGKSFVGVEPGSPTPVVPAQVRMRLALEELGPTFVKLGQVLSTRSDLIPQEWADEFRKLQNNVPPVGYEQIRKVLEVNFPNGVDEIFSSIETEPLAAGSMAQVHRARLRVSLTEAELEAQRLEREAKEKEREKGVGVAMVSEGTNSVSVTEVGVSVTTGPEPAPVEKVRKDVPVVIKILRPEIVEVIRADMEILRVLAGFVESRGTELGYSPTEVVNEFARELRREVDLACEGQSTDRLRRMFANDPGVHFPRVYWHATTHAVLTIDEMKGKVLANLPADALSPEMRRAVVENGARAVFKQCLEVGFFHADPHPGNLMAMPDGSVGFIDCGMTGQVDRATANQLADLVEGMVKGDLDKVLDAAAEIADVGPEKLDDRTLRAEVNTLIGQFRDTPLERLQIGQILQDFFSILREHQIRCPADIVLLIKALTTIEAVGRELDPTFRLGSFVRPQLETLVKRRYSPRSIRSMLMKNAQELGRLFETAPKEARSILRQIRRNRLGIRFEHEGLDDLTGTLEHASRNISSALMISAIFLGSSILMLAARDGSQTFFVMGIAGFIVAGLLALSMTLANRRHRK